MEEPLRVLIVEHHDADCCVAEHLLTDYDLDFSWQRVGELPRLRELLGRIQAGDLTGLAQLQIFAHRIRGSGATFDFAAISEGAGRVENLAEVLIGTWPLRPSNRTICAAWWNVVGG